MEKSTKEFIEIAYLAMQKAYWHESKEMTNCDSDTAKKVAETLEMVGALTRMV